MKTIKLITHIEMDLAQEWLMDANKELFTKVKGEENTYVLNKPITKTNKYVRESIQKYGLDLMHMENVKKIIYKTGGITIIPYERTIKNENGSIVLLNKLMELLLALVEGDRSLRTRDSLKQSISLRKAADDNSLNSYVCRLRLELAKISDEDFIKTYSSNGYKWMFPVEKISLKK